MYSKDKTFSIHFRVSSEDYTKLIDKYDQFIKNMAKPISFSEYLRRRCLYGCTEV